MVKSARLPFEVVLAKESNPNQQTSGVARSIPKPRSMAFHGEMSQLFHHARARTSVPLPHRAGMVGRSEALSAIAAEPDATALRSL
jgi:hypothetical protein